MICYRGGGLPARANEKCANDPGVITFLVKRRPSAALAQPVKHRTVTKI